MMTLELRANGRVRARSGARVGGRVLASALALALLGGLAACGNQAPSEPTPQPRRTSWNSGPSPEPVEPTDGSSPSEQNDLSSMPLRRTLRAGGIEVSVEYRSDLPVAEWRAETTKPLFVTASAVNQKKQKQKIYLATVTMTVSELDEDGQQLDAARPIIDSANVQPGYIVTSPNTYNQNFVIPAVDRATTNVKIDMSYEMLLEVGGSAESRDLAKQVATDTLTVPIVAG